MKALGGFLLLCVLSATLLVAACSKGSSAGVLQPSDLSAPPDGGTSVFNPNNVVDPAAFTDIETIKVDGVQKFVHRGPYDRPSFLETYQSNGVRASEAIAAAALNYRINPLVFLVFAEMSQGLVGAKDYPFPPERVEYVFRCGCFSSGNCLETLAGFDRQVDCLGRQLRDALDQIGNSTAKKTASGWGTNVTSTTVDDVVVKPANASTAALYDRVPMVNLGTPGGTWVFWNIWQLYAPKLDYAGPVGAIDGRWIGEGCAIDSACGFDQAVCAQNYPGGLCTTSCTGDCPTQPSKPDAYCAKFKDGEPGFCFKKCLLGATESCRAGYKCTNVAGMKAGDSQAVCSPDPNAATAKSSDTTN